MLSFESVWIMHSFLKETHDTASSSQEKCTVSLSRYRGCLGQTCMFWEARSPFLKGEMQLGLWSLVREAFWKSFTLAAWTHPEWNPQFYRATPDQRDRSCSFPLAEAWGLRECLPNWPRSLCGLTTVTNRKPISTGPWIKGKGSALPSLTGQSEMPWVCSVQSSVPSTQ